MVDLFNQELVGMSCGWHKDAALVLKAYHSIPYPLTAVDVFHTDRGKEFDNQLIDDLLTTFDISRSLSAAGNPYDNAVAESTFHAIKVEFIQRYVFESLEQLELLLRDYIRWWNYDRLHGTLNYQTPMIYRYLEQATEVAK